MSDSENLDFIRQIVADDLAAGKHEGGVATRFPPEPNGYLHLGHAKSICLNFGIADEFGGTCNLRFDDTNPEKEEQEYVDAIQADISWLGFHWEKACFASDYFERLFEYALDLIRNGLAYVCDLSGEEIRKGRGTLKEPGVESPFSDREPDENEDLLRRMRAGEFPDGSKVLRAKIDMAHPNLIMRDPVLYRIRRAHHHRTGDDWPIYPTYDFAHGQSDSIEGITHSVCTLEFENHRPLYDWLIDKLGIFPSRQYEFAPLNLEYTLMSKRKLIQLVQEGHVAGWDDPRLPTLRGIRRRGVPAEAIRNFCRSLGVTKFDSTTDYAFYEHSIREVLNRESSRAMAVMDPLPITITNFEDGEVLEVDAVNNPERPEEGSRKVPFSNQILIERSDFMEEPPKKFFRLTPGSEVRLRYSYVLRCDEVKKDEKGSVVSLVGSIDRDTLGKQPEGRKVKGVIHWVSAKHALRAEVRLYDRLFSVANPGGEDDPIACLNPNSLQKAEAFVEPSLANAEPGMRIQFERTGYFVCDDDSSRDRLVFNRTVTLKDSWGRGK
ncbi:MAG: glutamine--tRNA ligase/YqeY domain fusion protein [Verrucomicrobiota bacterium]